MLPNKLFFTGAPGSKWSGISQVVEKLPGFNNSDHSPDREYLHHKYSGHKGAYFGTGMEYEAGLDEAYLDQAWRESGGCKLVKSHDWAPILDHIKYNFCKDWIMLVHRPDQKCLDWWLEAGGFDIKYPDYSAFVNKETMFEYIKKQNYCILDWASKKSLKWEKFTQEWLQANFETTIDFDRIWDDVLVTLWKP